MAALEEVRKKFSEHPPTNRDFYEALLSGDMDVIRLIHQEYGIEPNYCDELSSCYINAINSGKIEVLKYVHETMQLEVPHMYRFFFVIKTISDGESMTRYVTETMRIRCPLDFYEWWTEPKYTPSNDKEREACAYLRKRFFPTPVRREARSDQNCCICLEECNESVFICGHGIHLECYDPSILNCPSCQSFLE